MATSVQLRRRAITGQTPTSILSGELQLNQADGQIWFGDAQALPNARPMLAIRFFSATAGYTTGDFVIQGGSIYRAIGAVTPSTFNAANWVKVAGLSMPADAVGSLTNDGAGNLSYVRALPLAGGTLTGPLLLAADPGTGLGAATKQYADLKLALAGGTLTGALVLAADPAAPLQPATKQYADLKLALAGGTLTGPLVLAGAPSAPLQAATKAYADAVGGGGNVGRNRLLNARFVFNQRAQIPFTTTGLYAGDRWLHQDNNAGSRTVGLALTLDADRTAIGDEEATVLVNVNTTGSAAAADFEILSQKIESVSTLAGKTVTLSFYALSTVAGKFLSTELYQYFGTGGSPAAPVLAIGATKHTLSAAWARYSVTFTVPSIIGKTKGTAGDDFLQVVFWFSAGSTYATRSATLGQQTSNISLWGIQLEEGSVATPLEKKSFNSELTDCQRYYQSLQVNHFGYAAAGITLGVSAMLPTPMRATPTATQSAISYGNASNLQYGLGQYGVFYYYVATALGQTQLGGSLLLSAEL